MARAVLAKRARKDLIEIRQYTVNRWGKEQARKYSEKGIEVARVLHDAMDFPRHFK
jgi:plasmid stabilization system protein ParE